MVVFFRQSRDRWKKKCQKAKRENKSLKTRLAAMKDSRDRWKAEAKQWRRGTTEVAATDEPAKNSTAAPDRRGHAAR